jgi:O-acetyl-ADP-ribose deacetylase (regulator of RNase III)
MLYYHGNLLAPENIRGGLIAHGCNALGVMGSGIAKAIKDQFPACFSEYSRWHQKNGLKLGEVVYYHHNDGNPENEVLIANCITQQNTGTNRRQVNYVAVAKAMSDVCQFANAAELVVRIPLIGAGLGGGDWKVISEIIKDCEVGCKTQVEVFVLEQKLYDKLIAGEAI